MTLCPLCGHQRIEFVYGLMVPPPVDDDVPEHLDPEPFLRVMMGCSIAPVVGGEVFGAWCPGCRTMFRMEDDAPITWEDAWGDPTRFIPSLPDPVELVEEWIGDVDDSVEDVVTLAEIGRWRGDRVLELYASYRLAGRGRRDLADVDTDSLFYRTSELLEELDHSQRRTLTRDGTLASIYAELARWLSWSGAADAELSAWHAALAHVGAAQHCGESVAIQLDAARALHDLDEEGLALELARAVFPRLEESGEHFLAAPTAALVAAVHRGRQEWREAFMWSMHQARAELREPDLWEILPHTRAAVEEALEALRDDPSALAAAKRELHPLTDDLDGETRSHVEAAEWLRRLISQ